MAKQNWPTAHIEMYTDGRTHLTFENDSPQTPNRPAVEKTKEAIKDAVTEVLGEKLQPGRAYRIEIKRVAFFRKTIEFDYERVR